MLIYIYFFSPCLAAKIKISRKGWWHAVAVVRIGEFSTVEGREQKISTIYVVMLVSLSSLTLLMLLKGYISNLLSKHGLESQVLKDLTILKNYLNPVNC